jgi:hypothetical protein
MDINSDALSDKEFLMQFENKTLNHKHFNHIGHLRIAWLYLSNNTIDQALALTCVGISEYAESLGAKDKFNKTITTALVHIIYKRINNKAASGHCWHDFINHNIDLIDNALSILYQHFSKELLFSESAKQEVVSPDRQNY